MGARDSLGGGIWAGTRVHARGCTPRLGLGRWDAPAAALACPVPGPRVKTVQGENVDYAHLTTIFFS